MPLLQDSKQNTKRVNNLINNKMGKLTDIKDMFQ